jgi:hypothetical protein
VKIYRITDINGGKREIQASDMRMALAAYENIYHYPEPVKVKLLKK